MSVLDVLNSFVDGVCMDFNGIISGKRFHFNFRRRIEALPQDFLGGLVGPLCRKFFGCLTIFLSSGIWECSGFLGHSGVG